VDAVVQGSELGMGLAEELRSLAPFGCANPAVSLLVRGASFEERRPMGEGRHVRFTMRSAGARTRAVAFGLGTRLPVPDGEPADATFALEVNEWRGVSEPRLVLRHAQPSAARAPLEPAGDGAERAARESAPDAAERPAREPPLTERAGALVLFA